MPSADLTEIQRLRAQAKSHLDAAKIFNEAADQLELLFNGVSPTFARPMRFYGGSLPVKNERKQLGPISADAIKTILKSGKQVRAYELTKLFDCTTAQVNAIIAEPDSGLYVAHRGWIKESDLLG